MECAQIAQQQQTAFGVDLDLDIQITDSNVQILPGSYSACQAQILGEKSQSWPANKSLTAVDGPLTAVVDDDQTQCPICHDAIGAKGEGQSAIMPCGHQV